MRAYSVSGSAATGTANKTAAGITGSATARPAIYEINVGSSTTAADNTMVFAVSRFTAAGTSTAYTPLPVDPGDVAAVAVAGVAHSVEPTYTAGGNLLFLPLNQRATYRWIASQPGYEFKGPATAANGMGLQLVSATSTAVLAGTFYYFE